MYIVHLVLYFHGKLQLKLRVFLVHNHAVPRQVQI
uniref:Uncharacterized protein n=1 Tax=Arundo donax TaxID=35708 RepID=A0A0A9B964_ARUDO